MKPAWTWDSSAIGNCRRSSGSTEASPACGPAPVTIVPVTRVATSARPDAAASWRSGRA